MMQFQSAWQRLTRGQDLSWILKNHGVLGTARWLRRCIPYYLWLHFTPAGWRERDFDQIHGVQTEGIVPRWEMGDVGPNLRFAVQYLPTKPRIFYRLLDSLPIEYSEFTFIDIGAGKGRVLLMASRYPFRRIVGVEFVPKLCDIARKNLEICRCPAEIYCMDATQYVFPEDPLVIYMCNPFSIEPMRKLVLNLEQSLTAKPRPAYLVYWNALHPQAFAESPHFAQVDFRRDEFVIFRLTQKQ
jgi:SAM-dependent methyltransferase